MEIAWNQCQAAPQDGGSIIRFERAGTLYEMANMHYINLQNRRRRRIQRVQKPKMFLHYQEPVDPDFGVEGDQHKIEESQPKLAQGTKRKKKRLKADLSESERLRIQLDSQQDICLHQPLSPLLISPFPIILLTSPRPASFPSPFSPSEPPTCPLSPSARLLISLLPFFTSPPPSYLMTAEIAVRAWASKRTP